ncbi:pyridoxal phosphate-dependent aminotransferase [Immundisolibacter sp.]|uniref:pyridoxal phosphate-dependent aminotransferase n=1 Tax=Immundisolibacter sp. TaxID=1934948 RepID=UPI002B1BC9A3|nr:pyridoxal phosphate-dependent aminotransferase [Immundisolibacter sp.]MEA3220585.1 Aspartate/prephenate aminotransferase [Immundisolibacter sp.]
MELKLAARVAAIKPSATMAVTAKAKELQAAGRKVIGLGAGEPDFDTPQHIKDAAKAAIDRGFTKYTAVEGTPELRRAIVDKFARENGLSYQPAQILVSSGGKQSFYNLAQVLLEEGDEVIIPAPYWVSYPDIVLLAGATPVILQTDLDGHFKISPAQLEAAITPRTKLLVLNSPSNPTGSVYSEAELAALAEVLLRHPQVWIASDDMYEHIRWDGAPFRNILNACPALYERTMVLNGVSKAYSMTGWRIGYAAGDARVISEMAKIQSQSTSNACSISQVAAQAALEGDQGFIQQMNTAFKQRHDFVVAALNDIKGIRCAPADGAFYCFFSVADAIAATPGVSDDVEFAAWLMEKAEVALVPGSAFGAPGYLRLSFATSMDNLKEAMRRLKVALG